MTTCPPKIRALQLAREIMNDPRERAFLLAIHQTPPAQVAPTPYIRKTPPRLPRKEAQQRAQGLAHQICAHHHVNFVALRGPIRTRAICKVRLDYYRQARAAGIPLDIIASTVRRVRTAVSLALIRGK